MNTPQISLPVRTLLTNPVDPTHQPDWKTWTLKFELYRNDDGNVAVLIVDDPHRLLNFDEVRVIPTATSEEAFAELATALEKRWSGYSGAPDDILHQPQNLASIGHDIFSRLFPTDPEDEDALPNQVVRLIQENIEQWIGAQKAGGSPDESPAALQLAFHSQILHLPWNLLYAFEDYGQYGDAGFLGMACSIEDQSRFAPKGRKVKKVGKTKWGVNNPIEISLQLDRKLRETTHRRVSNQLAEYGVDSVRMLPRTTWRDFKEALQEGRASEEIMYFCCHTHQSPPQMRLTDGQPISTANITTWTGQANLAQWPVVFLNTCRGGLVDKRYRTDFVVSFINGGAVAVIGAEAEIDEDYAAAYAEEYFQRLFSVGDRKQSLGDVAYQTRLALLKERRPLSGLLYSVYSRKPIRFVERTVRRKDPVPHVVSSTEDRRGSQR